MLAWTKQNTMQSAMRTVLEWPQSHAIRKTINMITNKYEPQQKCRKPVPLQKAAQIGNFALVNPKVSLCSARRGEPRLI